ncbi:DUF4258 domain-containing protein [Polynucleobacter arcticus]|nr:DUF4258 domain-containing protein [Polynucleobacter arcticus]
MSKLSKIQFQTHIRRVAMVSINVTVTQHANVRMRERQITNAMLFDVLRHGLIRREPEPDLRHSGIKCQMERYSGGSNIAVVVNVDFPSDGVVVITVFGIS